MALLDKANLSLKVER